MLPSLYIQPTLLIMALPSSHPTPISLQASGTVRALGQEEIPCILLPPALAHPQPGPEYQRSALNCDVLDTYYLFYCLHRSSYSTKNKTFKNVMTPL